MAHTLVPAGASGDRSASMTRSRSAGSIMRVIIGKSRRAGCAEPDRAPGPTCPPAAVSAYASHRPQDTYVQTHSSGYLRRTSAGRWDDPVFGLQYSWFAGNGEGRGVRCVD